MSGGTSRGGPLLILIDAHSGVPIYRQLVEQIRSDIVAGMLAPEDALPSTRSLAQELGINPMTVSKAYAQLEKDGLIERRSGLQCVVAPLPPEQQESNRIAEVSAALEPAVRTALRLDIPVTTATRLFRMLLEEAERRSEGSE